MTDYRQLNISSNQFYGGEQKFEYIFFLYGREQSNEYILLSFIF